ncbi:hypothetical protein [Ruegeria hyattellae]|uniref:hypothetical protein n=1 Tax=Ruegeria hyattellae TaxID=3233337 RepID=UPI00355C7D32
MPFTVMTAQHDLFRISTLFAPSSQSETEVEFIAEVSPYAPYPDCLHPCDRGLRSSGCTGEARGDAALGDSGLFAKALVVPISYAK